LREHHCERINLMRALLLSAGLGTRLRPLTETTPKCLVLINGKPLLGIWLEILTRAGIERFLINTHYLSNKVEKFINESPYRDQITIVHETKLKGTAGTLLSNLDFFADEDALLIHADNYCSANFDDFIKAHRDRPLGCLITMMTFVTCSPSECGIVECNDLGVVINFHEKIDNPPGNIANAAIYILSKEFIMQYQNLFINASDFSNDVLPKLLGRIYTYKTVNTLIDIGTLENYRLANNLK